MFGLKRHVLITVVNDIPAVEIVDGTGSSTRFDPYLEIRKSLKSTLGNTLVKQDLIKESRSQEEVKFVYQAYGEVGINFNTHVAVKRHRLEDQLQLNDPVSIGDEIVLITNEVRTKFSPEVIVEFISRHRIIPSRRSR